jgi:DNA-binding transcriptional regulator LsrR (DeoR family)
VQVGVPELSQPNATSEPVDSGRAAAAYAAARLYFEEELSQAAVAERLSVSRSTVSRLIAEARESGIVRIEIRPPIAEARLGDELAAILDLRRVVISSHGEPGPARPLLLSAAARQLGNLGLRADDVLLLGWGRSLWELATAALPPLAGVRIVPAVGGMEEHQRPFQTNEIVRRAAERSGAVPHLLHAPAAPSPALRRALLADTAVNGVVALWDRIDAAVVGIGVPPGTPGSFTPGHALAADARSAIAEAAGDIATRYFDLAGGPVAYAAEKRLIAVSREQLRAARTVIGVAAGENKHRAIVGAARAGLIDVLVTDTATAAAALELAGATG